MLFPGDRSIPGAHALLLLVLLAEPAGGDALGFRVESDPVPAHHVEVAEEGVLVPGEGEVGHGHGNPHVDPDHAPVRPADELPGVITVLGEDAGAVGEPVVVHDRQPLLEILDPLDGRSRGRRPRSRRCIIPGFT